MGRVCGFCAQDRNRREREAEHQRAADVKHQREMKRLHEKQVAQQGELLDLRKRELRELEAARRASGGGGGGGAADGMKGLLVLVVGVVGIGWYAWTVFFRQPEPSGMSEPTAPAGVAPVAAATSEPPVEVAPTEEPYWCVCFREGSEEEIMDVTACRPSESACERLERSARSSSGSRSILPESLVHECAAVGRPRFEALGWQPSTVAGGWVWNGECRLRQGGLL